MIWEGRAPLFSHRSSSIGRLGLVPPHCVPALTVEPGEQESGVKEAIDVPIRIEGHGMQISAEDSQG